MELYKEGYKLEENEYLLKLRESDQTIFLSKLTQKGALPVKFAEWGIKYDYQLKYHVDTIPNTYIFKESFREGWQLLEWRFGMSQNWAKIITPEGYKIEIYLSNFLDIVKSNTIINGSIKGAFMWADNKLIKQE